MFSNQTAAFKTWIFDLCIEEILKLRVPTKKSGSSHHYKRNFDQAIVFHNNVLRLAHELKDHTIEARAYAGLGHAAR